MKELMMFKNQIVRDLAWTIASPPLVRLNSTSSTSASTSWCAARFTAFLPHLLRLDRDPAPIVERIDINQSFRLGKYFENLIAFWLEESPEFELLGRNMQIRDGKETVGEMDFLVRNLQDKSINHWEVAVKFYLGFPTNHDLASWHGPAKRDNLARKMRHLTRHQLHRSRHPVAARMLNDMGLTADSSFLFVKGRLFHGYHESWPLPAENPESGEDGILIHRNHLYSWWLTASLFAAQNHPSTWTWHPLNKPNWLSDQTGLDASYPSSSKEELVEIAEARPVYAVALEGGREVDRGFLVPDGWSEELSRT